MIVSVACRNIAIGKRAAFMGVPSVEDGIEGFSFIRHLLLYTTRVTNLAKYL